MKTTQINNDSDKKGKTSMLKVLKYAGIIIGSIVLLCLLLFILFPDTFINSLFKERITKTINETFPAYSIQFGELHYSVWANRISVDSVKLQARDSAISVSVASLSVGGIGWINTFWQSNFDSGSIKNLVIDVEQIAVNFRAAQNTIHLGMLHISVPDSEIVSDSVKYYSLIDDEQLFAKSQFKQTRFNIEIPKIEITGLDFPALLYNKFYKAASINIHDLFADILVNMDKPVDRNSANPLMPNEALSSIKEIVKVDSLNIINGLLKYNERFAVGAKPGNITFNKINVSVIGIANHTEQPDTAIIIGEGLLMNSGNMKLFMAIPLTPNDFSFQYSGSLSSMNAATLNAFIEAGEHQRIKSGIVHSANFQIYVNSGHATGTLRVAYQDLSIAVLDKETGSEKGIFNQISSFLGEVFVIRGTNMPDENGSMKIGNILHTRKPGEPFFQFIWFALRSGVGDVVGFPPEAFPDN